MKSAYELAMERLEKQSPQARLTTGQKKEIADLDSRYKAKQAEREIGLKDQIAQAVAAGNREEVEALEAQLNHERRKIQAELEEKKEAVRNRGKK